MPWVRVLALGVLSIGLIAAGCGKIELYTPVKGAGVARTYEVKITDSAFDPASFWVQAGIKSTVVVKADQDGSPVSRRRRTTVGDRVVRRCA